MRAFVLSNEKAIILIMNIVDAFLEGKIQNSNEERPEHISTVVSDVFLFKSKVYKIYKSNSDFFNKNFKDFSDKNNRFLFTIKDFEWNNSLTPEIYIKLHGVEIINDEIRFIPANDEALELVIEMNRFDSKHQLINLLNSNLINLEDCFKIGQQLGERSKHLPRIEHQKTAYEDFLSRYNDIIPWVNSVESIPKEKIDRLLIFLKDYINEHRDELNSVDLMGTCIDLHIDNAVYDKGNFLPIDIFAPKEEWLHGYKFLNLYRIATDIYGFLGKKGFDQVLSGYEFSTKEKLPRDHDKFLITYCELINWPYQLMLSAKEPWRIEIAKKYEDVLNEIFGWI